ncbi:MULTISPECIES: hypothetical protein [Streptomyces]|uniref:hypothetical protein n=1 Tax=Streptomyces TaxID=1883 RepID=UPI0034613621
MRTWPVRRWVVALAVTVLAALVIGVPTGVISTPLYTRMTPVLWWNYPVWAVTSALEGLLVATYVRGAEPAPQDQEVSASRPRTARALAAAVLSAFAVGCPICNKLVVLAIGVSGAMSFWAPAQPVLALASIALLAHALVRRLRTAEACTLPA